MMTLEHMTTLQELDRILIICQSEEGKHLLDEMKKLDFYQTLQKEPTDSLPTGPLTFLANIAEDASQKANQLQYEVDETKSLLKEIVLMLEQQLYNKGDNSPSECSMVNEINLLRSKHSFLY